MKKKLPSLITYLFFLALAFVTMFWGQFISQTQTGIRVWNWAAWLPLLAGIPFILLQKEAGLPEVWEPVISNKKRLLIPFAIGLLFGAVDVILINFIMHPGPYKSLPPFLQPFPYSIALYTSGAFDIEVFYRLIPITLLLLIANKLKWSDRKYNTLFWFAAVITSLREPLEQFPEGTWWFICYSLITGFAMNLLQAVYFRKAGFLASMMIRLGHYFLWHILLGIYIERTLAY